MRQLNTLIPLLFAGLYGSYSAYAARSIDTPEEAVRYFYSLLPTQCSEAIKIRPSYTLKQCRDILKADVTQVVPVKRRENFADLKVTVRYSKRGLAEQEKTGCVTLMKQNGGWWMFVRWVGGRCPITVETSQAEMEESIPTDAGDIKYQESPLNWPTLTNDKLPFDRSEMTGQTLGRCWSNLRGNPSERRIQPTVPNPGAMDQKTVTLVEQLMQQQQSATWGSIRFVNVHNGKKPIALTFDLCERANEKSGYDAAIVNYLRDNNIKATFYAGGKWMRSHPDKTMQLMASPLLFEIGNHGWTHGNMRMLRGQRMRDQITWTQAQYYKIRQELVSRSCLSQQEKNLIPLLPATFRFPYGTCNQGSLDTLNDLNLAAIQWSIVTGDPARGQTAQGIADIVLKQAKPGAIIIAHANGRGHGTAASLPLFIPKLLKQGYKFVTISELLRLGQPYTTSECFEVKSGDNKRYDRLFGEGTGE